MARRIKLGRTVGWAAGVGITNWLLRRRSVTPDGNPTNQVPAQLVDHDMKEEVYRLRGETVSIGGMVEGLIATLATRFARSKKAKSRTQWKDLKRHLKSTDLKEDLGDDPGKVNAYFKPRNLAAHAGVIISDVAGSIQILRLIRTGGDLEVDLVTLQELRREVATARSGYEAIRAIGRALNDRDPSVLSDMDDLTRGMLLGGT